PEAGQIHCEITHTTIDVPYSCLSYVWGSEEPECVIFVNNRHFKIRRNLYNFLCSMHLDYVTRSLWIDALCIDQSNPGEKNHQVRHMGDIFKAANQVIAWLGKDEDNARFL
ncbi:HET-domain-containing protein, partial [Setomelanomma holmii]